MARLLHYVKQIADRPTNSSLSSISTRSGKVIAWVFRPVFAVDNRKRWTIRVVFTGERGDVVGHVVRTGHGPNNLKIANFELEDALHDWSDIGEADDLPEASLVNILADSKTAPISKIR